MERTAEEFVHQLPARVDSNRSWFVGDYEGTMNGHEVYMMPDGKELTDQQIATGNYQLYTTKRSCKRAAQKWLEKTLDEVAAEPDDPIPPCAAAMGCLCAGHARGNPADAACDTRELSVCSVPNCDNSVETAGDACGECETPEAPTFAEMPVAVINIRLEIKGAPGDALAVVDTMLDNGDPQDTINEHDHQDAGPLHVLDARVTEGDHEERLRAVSDIVEVIWPPGVDRPDDDALRGQSAVLAAIMDRLAFLKPGGAL